MTLVPLDAPAAPLALTSDELRAIARCMGTPLTSLLLEDDDEADAPLADAVALRSLAARGLATITGDPFDGGAVRLSAWAGQVLAPLLSPEALVEVEADRAGSHFVERHVVCVGGSRTLVLTEADEADVWLMFEASDGLGPALAAVARLPEAPASRGAGTGRRLTVPAAAHQAADDALEDGGNGDAAQEAAIAVLIAAGADRPTAQAWIAAVAGRTCSVELRAARLLPGDVVDAAELRILSAGPSGTWLIDLDEPEGDAALEADQAWEATTSVMIDVGAAAAADAVAGLLSAPRHVNA